MKPDKESIVTEGENRIIEAIGEGLSTPSELASSLKISVSAVSQHLSKLYTKGIVEREKQGKSVIYSLKDDERRTDFIVPARGDVQDGEEWKLIRESYEALNKVWGHVLKLDLKPDELKKLREARNLLEEILHKRIIAR